MINKHLTQRVFREQGGGRDDSLYFSACTISGVHLSRYVARRQNKALQISRRTKGLPSKNKKGAERMSVEEGKERGGTDGGREVRMDESNGRTNELYTHSLSRCEIL